MSIFTLPADRGTDDVAILKQAAALARKTKGQVRIAVLAALVERLGWRVEEVVGAAPASDSMNDAIERAAGLRRVTTEGRGDFRIIRPDVNDAEKLRAVGEVVGAEGPRSPVEGRFYFERLDLVNRQMGAFEYPELHIGRVWIGARGWRFTPPKVVGKNAPPSHTVFALPGRFQNGVADDPGFWTWAYKHTTLEADAKAYSDAGGGVEAAKAKERERSGELENTGTCPVCGRTQKLRVPARGDRTLPLMVDHGYQLSDAGGWGFRAGGERVGSCWGVGFPPWELSPRGLMDFRDRWAKPHLADLLRESNRLKDGAAPVSYTFRTATDGKPETVELRRGDAAQLVKGARIPSHADALATAREQNARAVERAKADLTEITGKIAGWKRVDLYDERKAGARAWPERDPKVA